MTTSLFIKSHSRDFPWLEWCKKSIEKNCSGFSEVVLCLPEGESFNWPGAKIVHVRETFTGYLFQQAVKLYADQLCSGDFITFQDSDTIFTYPVTPETFLKDGKPIWITRPWDAARPDQQIWRGPTSKFIGHDAPFEGMFRHPFTVHRSVLQRMRGFCQFQHGVSLDEYIKQREVPGSPTALTFSEWNALGAFGWFHAKDQFHWIDASREEPPPAVCFQGYTWGGEQRKQEDLSKFREILDVCVGATEERAVSLAPAPLTVPLAIEFLASQVRDNFHKARIIRDLKKAWKGKGEHPKTRARAVSAPKKDNWRKGILLCVHSYPGANETFDRHLLNYDLLGADRIVGIGTTDDKCEWPEGLTHINIGENGYMKLKGKDDHLCRRLLDTVKWCLTQPEDKFAIIEYDTVPLRKMPNWKGVNAFRTGGQINGSKAQSFYHNPWLFDRASGEALVRAMEEVLPESQEYPDNSPDLFFGLACERAGIPVGCSFRLFTRNSLDAPGDLDLAVQAALEGAHVIHGVKEGFEYETIMSALNDEHLALSHT